MLTARPANFTQKGPGTTLSCNLVSKGRERFTVKSNLWLSRFFWREILSIALHKVRRVCPILTIQVYEFCFMTYEHLILLTSNLHHCEEEITLKYSVTLFSQEVYKYMYHNLEISTQLQCALYPPSTVY